MRRVKNDKLKAGDTIKVWWSVDGFPRNQDTINKITPYNGPLKYLWPKGAFIAHFNGNRAGMTMANDDYSNLIFN